MIRTGKSLLKTLYITLGTFLFLFVVFHIGGALYVSSIEEKSSNAFHAGIAHDLAYLKEQGDAIAENDLLQKYLITQNSAKLTEITEKEIVTRSVGRISVTDSDGTLLSKTNSVGNLGNNAFLTTPQGRAVDHSGSIEGIEVAGYDPTQLLMITGKKIVQNNRTIGALFANYFMNDTYATRFRNTYLSPDAEVVFYTKNFGVYGESFSDPETRKVINSYFNSGSEWVQNGISGKTFSLKHGSFYLVKNIVFPGLEQSPGGALIFTPRQDFSDIANILTALLTLLIFVFLALLDHLRSRGGERGWRYYLLLIFVSIPVLAFAFLAPHLNSIGYLTLGRVSYTLYNSTLRLQPEFGIYNVDFEQHFSIIVDTGDEAINAVQIGLLFDPKTVEVKALEVASSTCSYVIENTIDAQLGRASLSCVVLKSDGERGSLQIADVVVVPRHPGIFTLSFDREVNKVLASDGLGTNVLRMSQSGSYQADNFDPTLFTSTSTPTKKSFVVFSPTHPNQSRWYNASTARFVWRGKANAVYAYAFDSSPDTIPVKTHTIQGSAVNVPIPGDGIFYFHLQLISGGPTTHYRVQADQSPPSITSIHLSAERIVVGDIVRFSFEAQDVGSGIQKNYYVDLGSHLFLPTGSQLFIPFLDLGDQKIILRVYDDAGNYSEKSQIIHVETP